MGQPVVVSRKSTRDPKVVRFETNRLLTGSGHEKYTLGVGTGRAVTPGAVLAARMFAAGKAEAVHVFGNLITVELSGGQTADGLDEIIRDLYQYYLNNRVKMPVLRLDTTNEDIDSQLEKIDDWQRAFHLGGRLL